MAVNRAGKSVELTLLSSLWILCEKKAPVQLVSGAPFKIFCPGGLSLVEGGELENRLHTNQALEGISTAHIQSSGLGQMNVSVSFFLFPSVCVCVLVHSCI